MFERAFLEELLEEMKNAHKMTQHLLKVTSLPVAMAPHR